MTVRIQSHGSREPDGVDRRSLLRGAAAITAMSVATTGASARDFGRGAEPQRYPDPDIVVIDPKRFKAKVGNTSIKRLSMGRRTGLERARPISRLERYSEQPAASLSRGRRRIYL